MADTDISDTLEQLPGDVGEQARSDYAATPLSTETPADASARQYAQDTATRQWGKVKAADLSSRGIPSFTTTSGDVKPYTDSTGAALTDSDPKNGVAYDSSGNAVRYSYRNPTLTPTVTDAYDGAPTQTDKAGNIYSTPLGLPWVWKGVDPDIAAQSAQQQSDKLNQQASSALSPYEQQAKVAASQANKAVAQSAKSTQQIFTQHGATITDVDGDPIDLKDVDGPTLKGALEDSFNKEYAAPAANETGWFTGSLSSSAQTIRQDIDTRKQASMAAADAHIDKLTQAQQATDNYQQIQSQRIALQSQRLDSVNQNRVAAGMAPVSIPGMESQSGNSNQAAGPTGNVDGTAGTATQGQAQIPELEPQSSSPQAATSASAAQPTLYDRAKNFLQSTVGGISEAVGSTLKGAGELESKAEAPAGFGMLSPTNLFHAPEIALKALGIDVGKGLQGAGAVLQSVPGLITNPAFKDDGEAKAGRFIGGAAAFIGGGELGAAAKIGRATTLIPTLFASGYAGQHDAAQEHFAQLQQQGVPVDPQQAEDTAHRAGLLGGSINAVLGIPLEGAGKVIAGMFGKATPTAVQAAFNNAYASQGAAGVEGLLNAWRSAVSSMGTPAAEAGMKGAALHGLDGVIKEVQTTTAQRVFNVAGRAARGAALGAGTQIAQNAVTQTYDPSQSLTQGAGGSALAFGALDGLFGAIGEKQASNRAAENKAGIENIQQQFEKPVHGRDVPPDESGQGAKPEGPTPQTPGGAPALTNGEPTARDQKLSDLGYSPKEQATMSEPEKWGRANNNIGKPTIDVPSEAPETTIPKAENFDKLADMGYSHSEIEAMSPTEADRRVRQNIAKPAAPAVTEQTPTAPQETGESHDAAVGKLMRDGMSIADIAKLTPDQAKRMAFPAPTIPRAVEPGQTNIGDVLAKAEADNGRSVTPEHAVERAAEGTNQPEPAEIATQAGVKLAHETPSKVTFQEPTTGRTFDVPKEDLSPAVVEAGRDAAKADAEKNPIPELGEPATIKEAVKLAAEKEKAQPVAQQEKKDETTKENAAASGEPPTPSGEHQLEPGDKSLDAEQRGEAPARATAESVAAQVQKLRRGALKPQFDFLKTRLETVAPGLAGNSGLSAHVNPETKKLEVWHDPKELADSHNTVQANFEKQGLSPKDASAKADASIRASIEEELIHNRQHVFERGGPQFDKTYATNWKKVPRVVRDIFQAMRNVKNESDAQKMAELERMVIQYRDTGTITEATFGDPFLEKQFERLKPFLHSQQDPEIEDNIARVMTLVAEHGQTSPESQTPAEAPKSETPSTQQERGPPDIKYVIPARAKAHGDKLVSVNITKFDAEFSKDEGFYVSSTGEGEMAGRRKTFEEFLKKGRPIEAPEVTIDDQGGVSFINGRHRYSVIRDRGYARISMAMSPESEVNARKFGLVAGDEKSSNKQSASPIQGMEPSNSKNADKIADTLSELQAARDFMASGFGDEDTPAEIKGLERKLVALRAKSLAAAKPAFYAEQAADVMESDERQKATEPDPEQIRDITRAYWKERESSNYPTIKIADVMERAGYDAPTMQLGKQHLAWMWKKGLITAIPKLDWVHVEDRVRAWGVKIHDAESGSHFVSLGMVMPATILGMEPLSASKPGKPDIFEMTMHRGDPFLTDTDKSEVGTHWTHDNGYAEKYVRPDIGEQYDTPVQTKRVRLERPLDLRWINPSTTIGELKQNLVGNVVPMALPISHPTPGMKSRGLDTLGKWIDSWGPASDKLGDDFSVNESLTDWIAGSLKKLGTHDGVLFNEHGTPGDTTALVFRKSALREPLSAAKPDTGKAGESESPRENLMREAEESGVIPKTEEIKGILRGDKTVMDAVRAKIKARTGKWALYSSKPDATLASDSSTRLMGIMRSDEEKRLADASDESLKRILVGHALTMNTRLRVGEDSNEWTRMQIALSYKELMRRGIDTPRIPAIDKYLGISISDALWASKPIGVKLSELSEKVGLTSIVDDIQKIMSPDDRLTPDERKRFIETGDPNAIGDARKTGIILDEVTAAMARRLAQMEAALKEARTLVSKLPEAQQEELMKRVDEGTPLKAGPYKQAIDAVADMDAKRTQEAKDWFAAHGQDHWANYQNFLKNIVPHYFEDQEQANKVIDQLIRDKKMIGGTGFLKHRADMTMREVIDWAKSKGITLKPKHTNVIDAVMDRWTQQERYFGAHEMIARMEANGTGHWENTDYVPKSGERMVNNIVGNRTVEDKDGNRHKQFFFANEPSAQIINNYLSRGLRQGHKWVENYFVAANALNSFQLGLSAFHGMFVTTEGVVSSFALGIEKLLHGDIKGLKDMALAPFSTWNDWKLGGDIRKTMLDPTKGSQLHQQIVDEMVAGGFRDGLDSFYKDNHIQKFLDALRAHNVFKTALHVPLAIVEAVAKPLMEHFVPRMKAAAVYKLAQMHLQRKPDMDPMEFRRALQEDVRSGNNRFGQMTYDNLHLHKTVKDLLMMMTRSLGWNWGSLAEIGGGIADWAKFAKNVAGYAAHKVAGGGKGRKPPGEGGDENADDYQPGGSKFPRVTNKMAYVVALPLIIGIFGALLAAMFGQPIRRLRDYYAIQTGEVDDHGHKVTVMLPSYMKDVLSFGRHPMQAIINKLHPILSLIGSMLQNKDFYGVEIRHSGDPAMKQILQELKYVGKQFVPFSITNANKLSGSEVSTPLKIATRTGALLVAPSSAGKSDAQNLADDLVRESLPQNSRTQEQADHSALRSQMVGLQRIGKGADEIAKAVSAGKLNAKDVVYIERQSRLTPLQASVAHLNLQDSERVLQAATPEEKQQIQPQIAAKEMRADRRPRFTGF